jgi:hypothetical protein
MKFDVIVGNPPYAAPTKNGAKDRGNGPKDLWDEFVLLSLSLVKDDGFVCLVHPSKWRKPGHKLWNMLKNKLQYLYIANDKEGYKTFGATTRFDWYIASAKDGTYICCVIDENGDKHEISLTDLLFLPNFAFPDIFSILAKEGEECCPVLYDASSYHNQKTWMSEIEDKVYVFPCVYGMYEDGIKCLYSSKNNGHFGVSKVIVSCGRYPYPLIDTKGKYGVCNNAFSILVDSDEEAQNIKKAIESDKFKKILQATKWANFQIDYKMFKYFRRDFWKEFI